MSSKLIVIILSYCIPFPSWIIFETQCSCQLHSATESIMTGMCSQKRLTVTNRSWRLLRRSFTQFPSLVARFCVECGLIDLRRCFINHKRLLWMLRSTSCCVLVTLDNGLNNSNMYPRTFNTKWSHTIITGMSIFTVLSMARPFWEFTRFIRWMQTKCQVATINPQTKPNDLGCESTCRLLPSTPTVAVYYYYHSAWMLIHILLSYWG